MTQNRKTKPKAKQTPTPPPSTSQTLTPSQYTHTLTKIAISQIIRTVGFTASQSSALDSLTRIAALYLQTLATFASSTAAITGNRTQSNLFDIVFALHDLCLNTGLKEVMKFVYSIDETPFARVIPHAEGVSGSVVFPSTMENLVVNVGPNVPRWLPPFPRLEPGLGSRGGSIRELWWEEGGRMGEGLSSVEESGGGGMEKKSGGRGEKVKFRIGVRKGKMGISDLGLRNGVCRGGKRVCLVKRLNNGVFGDEEEHNVDGEIGND